VAAVERAEVLLGPGGQIAYDISCRKCARLADFLDDVKVAHPDYFCRPVPPFGDPDARFLIVGLAPGLHGANATGRPFTGDWCGPLLYSTLFRFGFSNQAESLSAADGLRLIDCRISNAVKCLPPQNKPELGEVLRCNQYLSAELAATSKVSVMLALGAIAHRSVLEALGLRASAWKFGHHAVHQLPNGTTLIDSYHVSRYNTQTRRLTPAMFDAVLADVKQRLR
jgi:uracil-DNA glycosylase family 4